MADHDELQPEEFHQRLTGVASTLDVGTFEQRARMSTTSSAVAAPASALLRSSAPRPSWLVATTVVLTMGGDEPDTLVTTDDTMAPDTILDDSVDAPEPTLDLPVPPAAGQPIDVTAGRVRSPAGTVRLSTASGSSRGTTASSWVRWGTNPNRCPTNSPRRWSHCSRRR